MLNSLLPSDGRDPVPLVVPLPPAADEGDGERRVSGTDGRLDDHEGAGTQRLASELGQGSGGVLKMSDIMTLNSSTVTRV